MTEQLCEIIEHSLENYLNIKNEEAAVQLAKLAVICRVGAKETIRHPNENKPYLMCVISGVIRGYYPGEHGRNYTVFFADHEGDPFWFPELITMDGCGFDALTDSTYLIIRWEDFRRVMSEYCSTMELENRFLRHRTEDQFNHRIVFQIYDATTRYLKFRDEYPGLESRIKDEYIADYLGITNVSLSRIRRKLRENAQKAGR